MSHFTLSAELQCLIKGPAVFQQAHKDNLSSRGKSLMRAAKALKYFTE